MSASSETAAARLIPRSEHLNGGPVGQPFVLGLLQEQLESVGQGHAHTFSCMGFSGLQIDDRL